MNTEKLIIGMPAGSLADPKRGGNMVDLLRAAGFPAQGYDQGGPTRFPLNTTLVGWDGRPQEFGSQLALNEIDIAIGGDDWIRERLLEFQYEYGQEVTLQRVMYLGRGSVRLVIVARPSEENIAFDAWLGNLLAAKPLVAMVSEMPYVALEWFQKKIAALGFEASHSDWAVQKYRMPPKIMQGLVIYESWGKTEAKVAQGAVDFGLEITQSGSAIRNYGLQIVDEIMQSQTGIWVNPRIKENPEKRELARMFLLNCYGAVFAENKALLFFNAQNEKVPALLRYLREKRLFGDEPTMNAGPAYTEFSIQAEMSDPALPIARVRYELARLGATHIETVPLDSCIPGWDAVDF